MATIPRVTTIRPNIERGEWLYVTPLSDLHIGGSAFDRKTYNALLSERSKLKNHSVVLLGDVFDLVVPTDKKRWRPSVQEESQLGRDDWINAIIDHGLEVLREPGVSFDMVSPGNHEDEFLKRHGLDLTSVLARELRCARGGYSGVLQYYIEPVGMLRMAYHHGAWGGRVAKGFPGARDFFRHLDGWHFALFGHNHNLRQDPEANFRVAKNGKLEEYASIYVCCGTMSRTIDDRDAGRTLYSERGGHAPTLRTAPLLKIRAVRHGTGYRFQYGVEVVGYG